MANEWRQALEMISEECETYKLGLQTMINEYDKAAKEFDELQKQYINSNHYNKKQIKKQMDEAKDKNCRYEVLRYNMNQQHRKAVIKYVKEFERLEALGINFNEIIGEEKRA